MFVKKEWENFGRINLQRKENQTTCLAVSCHGCHLLQNMLGSVWRTGEKWDVCELSVRSDTTCVCPSEVCVVLQSTVEQVTSWYRFMFLLCNAPPWGCECACDWVCPWHAVSSSHGAWHCGIWTDLPFLAVWLVQALHLFFIFYIK